MSDVKYPNASRPFANLAVDTVVRTVSGDFRVLRVMAPGTPSGGSWSYVLSPGGSRIVSEADIQDVVNADGTLIGPAKPVVPSWA